MVVVLCLRIHVLRGGLGWGTPARCTLNFDAQCTARLPPHEPSPNLHHLIRQLGPSRRSPFATMADFTGSAEKMKAEVRTQHHPANEGYHARRIRSAQHAPPHPPKPQSPTYNPGRTRAEAVKRHRGLAQYLALAPLTTLEPRNVLLSPCRAFPRRRSRLSRTLSSSWPPVRWV